MRAVAIPALALLAACAAIPPVADRTWYWLGTLGSRSAIDSPSPERYTLRIAGERAAIRADCNRGAGGVSLERDRVRFGPMAVTRAFCPPPARDEDYLRQLQDATRLEVRGDVLRVETAGAGAMFFATDPSARSAHYRCGGDKVLSVVFAGERAQLWYDGAHYALARERSASGARYGDGAVTLVTQGGLASLRGGGAVLAAECRTAGGRQGS